ncbi:hypothetical protein THH46_17140 [Pseudomonas sp. NA13]
MQLASGKSLGIDATVFGTQDDTAQMRLLHAGMVRAGMLPQRSAVDAMRGPARAFGTALRTVYQPQHRYTGPVRLVLANDPTLDTAGNKREQEQMIEGWRKHILTSVSGTVRATTSRSSRPPRTQPGSLVAGRPSHARRGGRQ